jgi:hypothetical protein
VVSELDQNLTWKNVYLHFNGKLFTRYAIGSHRTQFIHTDHRFHSLGHQLRARNTPTPPFMARDGHMITRHASNAGRFRGRMTAVQISQLSLLVQTRNEPTTERLIVTQRV